MSEPYISTVGSLYISISCYLPVLMWKQLWIRGTLAEWRRMGLSSQSLTEKEINSSKVFHTGQLLPYRSNTYEDIWSCLILHQTIAESSFTSPPTWNLLNWRCQGLKMDLLHARQMPHYCVTCWADPELSVLIRDSVGSELGLLNMEEERRGGKEC